MDPRSNPYTPNAGAAPPALVGRNDQLESFGLLLARMQGGYTEQSLSITGLRGVGKTVLLDRFREQAEASDWSLVEILTPDEGNRLGTVGIDPGADPHIVTWLERRESLGLPAGAPLFFPLQGRPLTGNTIRDALRTLAHRAGIEKRVHPRGFRHSHAYVSMMESIPMPIIQRQLGHVSLATTDRYLAHIAPKQVVETMAEREGGP